MEVKKPGQVVLFEFPQTDLTSTKLRPVLLLWTKVLIEQLNNMVLTQSRL